MKTKLLATTLVTFLWLTGLASAQSMVSRVCTREDAPGENYVCQDSGDTRSADYILKWNMTDDCAASANGGALTLSDGGTESGVPVGIVACSDDNSGVGSAVDTIQDEDSSLTQRSTLNFEGGGITCADDTSKTTCTVPGFTDQFCFIVGAENGSTLVDTDDQPSIWSNRRATGITITEIWCESDAGTPSINLQRDDGSAANILSSNLTCDNDGATSSSFSGSEASISNDHDVDFVMVSASTAKRVTMCAVYSVP